MITNQRYTFEFCNGEELKIINIILVLNIYKLKLNKIGRTNDQKCKYLSVFLMSDNKEIKFNISNRRVRLMNWTHLTMHNGNYNPNKW